MSDTAMEVTDEATAVAALVKARTALAEASEQSLKAMSALRSGILKYRPTGLLSVEEIAAAIGRDRDYVDSVWSDFGGTQRDENGRVKQTRVRPSGSAGQALKASEKLGELSRAAQAAEQAVTTARSERNRNVALVYSAKLLGPSRIGEAVGVDRNHVLRIARKHGVPPMHRPTSRNQYSA